MASTTSTTLGVPGDADGNGLVDYQDLIMLAVAYFTEEGDEHYNPSADFNSDGIIDFEDLMILAENYQAG